MKKILVLLIVILLSLVSISAFGDNVFNLPQDILSLLDKEYLGWEIKMINDDPADECMMEADNYSILTGDFDCNNGIGCRPFTFYFNVF